MIDDLRTLISQQIKRNQGKISFADYMQQALYHPQWGYYAAQIAGIGKSGDFITAPEISPLFARCIAHQARELAEKTGSDAILEIGAGSGRLASDLLAFDATSQYFILEPSARLRQLQSERNGNRITHLSALPHDFNGLIIANEVLDALPFNRIEINGDAIQECVVAENQHGFYWDKRMPKQDILNYAQEILALGEFPVGYQTEIHSAVPDFVKSLTQCLGQGLILLFDYGYGRSEYYHPERMRGTMTCFRDHTKHHDPFYEPGKSDISTHVNFTQVVENACDAGAELAGFTTQAGFLFACDIMRYVDDSYTTHQQLKMLTMPSEMGDVIKVMGLAKDVNFRPVGFSLLDRRRDL